MTTDTMIRQLRYTAKKHENDKLHTFDTNISLMCTEVADRLEEIEKEKSESRTKAIEEFAEKIELEISESIIWDILATASENSSLSDISDEIIIYITETIKETAESMKGEKE